MAWKFNLAGETLSGGSPLKVGTFDYFIKSFKMEVNKKDPSGKEMHVVADLVQGGDYDCRVYLSVMSDNEQAANIADKAVRSIVLAAGVTKFEKVAGNTVSITAIAKQGTGQNSAKTYVNISTVQAAEGDDDEPEAAVKPKANKPAVVPEAEEEKEEEEEEEEQTPPPAGSRKARPW